MSEGYWYCPRCQRDVDGCQVAHDETHDLENCGTKVWWVAEGSLEGKILALESQLAEAKAEIERRNTETYCAYCGKRYPLDDQAATLVSEHIRTCEKHPMREVESQLAAEKQDAAVGRITTQEVMRNKSRFGMAYNPKETPERAWNVNVRIGRKRGFYYGPTAYAALLAAGLIPNEKEE